MAVATTSADEHAPLIRIEPKRGWISLGLPELWKHRELVYFLTWRDIKVRYKQTLFGASWAIAQPFLQMVVFSIIFGKVAKLSPDGLPHRLYPLWSFAALVPWQFFSDGITKAAASLVSNSRMITKIYMPRLVLPVSASLGSLVDMFLAFIVLAGMMIWFHHGPTIHALWMPAILLLAYVSALGVGLWLAALNVRYRDVKYVAPFITQIWLFVTPVVWPASRVSPHLRLILAINPMAGVVQGSRWALLGVKTPPGPMVAVSTTVAIIALITGLIYFRRVERTFADIV